MAGLDVRGFIQYFIANKPEFHNLDSFELFGAFIKQQVDRAMHDGDLTTFVEGLRREPWLLSDPCVKFQVLLIEVGVLNDRVALINALFNLDPALLHARVPPPSQAIEFAFTYVKTHLLPLLLRIWPLPEICRTRPGTGTSHA